MYGHWSLILEIKGPKNQTSSNTLAKKMTKVLIRREGIKVKSGTLFDRSRCLNHTGGCRSGDLSWANVHLETPRLDQSPGFPEDWAPLEYSAR